MVKGHYACKWLTFSQIVSYYIEKLTATLSYSCLIIMAPIRMQVPNPEPEKKETFTKRLSTHELLLIQISKYDRTKLKKASTVRY